MTDRRYTDEEISAIFLAAAEAPMPPPHQAAGSHQLTLAELQDIGREVGIAPEAVAQAARSLDVRRPAASRSFLGLPIGVERSVALDRALTDEAWERLVVRLRETFHASGTATSHGSLRQWTNGNLQVLVEPTATGHRLRLATLKRSARASMTSGLAVAGMGGAVAIASATAGHVAAGLPGVALLLAAGMAIFAGGALPVPGWARRRGRQFEEIIAQLPLPAAPRLGDPARPGD